MASRVFMNGHYYLMDDLISIYYSWYWDGYFAHILLAIFCFAGHIRMAYDHALPWISMANPFLWMTAARCANAAAGISDGCVVVRGIMPQAFVYRDVLRSADTRFDLIEPG